MDREHEEVERIPWAMLAEDIGEPRRRWILQAVAMAVVAVVVAILAVQVMRRPSGTTIDLAPSGAVVVESPASAPLPSGVDHGTNPTLGAVDGVTEGNAVGAAPPNPAPLYSEADLMAVLPEQLSLLAAARAEWFVVDFFGATGDGAVPGLPNDLPTPELGDGYSWVEWAKAIDAKPRPAGGFDVTVAFRTLTGSDDAGYQRMPVRAVVVPIGVDQTGSAAVIDLPTPATIPVTKVIDTPPLEDLPAEVAEAASATAESFGEPLGVVGGSSVESGWRVVVQVGDRSGVHWPLVVYVDG